LPSAVLQLIGEARSVVRSSMRRPHARMAVIFAGSFSGVPHQLFQKREIIEKAAAPIARQGAHGLRTIACERFLDINKLGVLQYLQMPTQVPIGKATEVLKVRNK